MPDLQELFGFTGEDLVLNRTGQLSSRQRHRLFLDSAGYLVRGVGVILVGLILLIYSLPQVDQPWELLAFSIIVTLQVIIVGFLLWAALNVARPSVRSVTGTLARTGSLKIPRVRIGNREMRVSRRWWKHLSDEYPGTVRAYYVRFEGYFLSAEALTNEDS